MIPRNILLPLDGANCTDAAIAAAAALARPERATVHLLYVVDIGRVAAESRKCVPGLFDWDQLADYPDGFTKQYRARGKETLDAAERRLTALGIPVTRSMEHGSPVGQIANHGRDADVVVLGRRGDQSADGLGSTAARVLARLPAPILLAGPAVTDAIKRPLLVYDGSASHNALIPTLELCGCLGTGLTVLHLTDNPTPDDRRHVDRHLPEHPVDLRWVDAPVAGGAAPVAAAVAQWKHDLVIVGARALGGEAAVAAVARGVAAPVLIVG